MLGTLRTIKLQFFICFNFCPEQFFYVENVMLDFFVAWKKVPRVATILWSALAALTILFRQTIALLCENRQCSLTHSLVDGIAVKEAQNCYMLLKYS